MTDAPAEPEFQFRVEVPFGPQWQHVELLRMSILNCLATIFQSHDFCEQLGMVTAELVENAIHYGHWDAAPSRPFRLTVRGIGTAVSVEVSNPIDDGSQNLERLLKIVKRLDAAPTPKDAYVARLREIAERPDLAGSGLGLLRVAYETGCRLDVSSHNGVARVVASIQGAPLS